MVASGLTGGHLGHAGSLLPSCAEAAGAYHVAVVVEHDNGAAPARMCVQVQQPEATAEAVLNASGVQYTAVDEGGSLGRAVCQVQGEPATPAGGFNKQNCFGGETWAIFCVSPWQNTSAGTNACYTADGSWQYARNGISSLLLRDGDALGLKFESSPARPAAARGLCPAVSGDRAPSPAPTTAPAGPPAAGSGGSGPPAGSPQPPGSTAAASGPRQPGPTASDPAAAAHDQGPGPDGAQTQPAGSTGAAIAGTPVTAASPRPRVVDRAPGAAVGQPVPDDHIGALAAAGAGGLLLVTLFAQLLLPRRRL